MSVMSDLHISMIEDANSRCAAPIVQSIEATAGYLMGIVSGRAEILQKLHCYSNGISALAYETGYTVAALWWLWSECIYEQCIDEGESLDRAWDDFCCITRELDW